MSKVINNYYIQVPMTDCLIPPTPPTMLQEIKGAQSRIIILDAETNYPTINFKHYLGPLDAKISKTYIKTVSLNLENLFMLYSAKVYKFIIWRGDNRLITLTDCRHMYSENVMDGKSSEVFSYEHVYLGEHND